MLAPHAAPITFQAATHGPPLWARLGWPWDARARALARAFDGWTAERLAIALSLNVHELERVLAGGSPPVLQEGKLGVIIQPLWLSPRIGGGFSASRRAAAAAQRIEAGSGVEVLALRSGHVLLRIMRAQQPDLLAWLPLEKNWAGLLALPLEA